jgi:hypothetical protein
MRQTVSFEPDTCIQIEIEDLTKLLSVEVIAEITAEDEREIHLAQNFW